MRYLAALILAMLMAVSPATAQTNFATMVTITPKGAFVLGNPRAKVRLVEYVQSLRPFHRRGGNPA
jgi:hypothetical protein